MITINLISPEQKQNLQRQKAYSAISRSVAIIFVYTAVISGLLLGSKYYLEQSLENILAEHAQEITNVQQLALSVKKINAKISAVSNIQKESYRFSPMLVKLAQLTPETIALNNVSLFKQEGVLELKGLAKTRNDLINFQKILEGSGLFKKIDLPLEALISKDNNSFDIKASLNLNYVAAL